LLLQTRTAVLNDELEPAFREWYPGFRPVVVPETVMAACPRLFSALRIEHLLVKTDWGLYRRTQAKATAFTLVRYFNRVLGLEPLNVARYAV
jgi:hypothetical protein